jgi:oxygen-independent coproporphyrinogen-3 oxidase
MISGAVLGAQASSLPTVVAVPRPLALYVHLPFCVRKCRYCDFNSGPAAEPLRIEYLTALRRELSARARELSVSARVDTIFFGGGTPTIYPADDLARLLDLVTDLFRVSPAAEISIEANPETLTPRKLRRLRAGGFNRLSIGAS